jgi:hypothetical protein
MSNRSKSGPGHREWLHLRRFRGPRAPARPLPRRRDLRGVLERRVTRPRQVLKMASGSFDTAALLGVVVVDDPMPSIESHRRHDCGSSSVTKIPLAIVPASVTVGAGLAERVHAAYGGVCIGIFATWRALVSPVIQEREPAGIAR